MRYKKKKNGETFLLQCFKIIFITYYFIYIVRNYYTYIPFKNSFITRSNTTSVRTYFIKRAITGATRNYYT